MKIRFLFLFLLFFVFSCSQADNTTVTEDMSEDFVDTYINTLDTSVQDARGAAELLNQKQGVLQQNIDALESE